MRLKKWAAAGLVLGMLLTSLGPGAAAVSAEETGDADKYVTLDGDWHFKLYRTYDQMFQYLPYGGVSVTWEDNELAKLPAAETWSAWETLQMPADDAATGGLLPMERGSAAEDPDSMENLLFPSWSEAWVCREFTLPADFTEDEEVTLLLGIIDDCDVVYINGHLVAASGFMDGSGNPTLNIPETGGFDYSNEDAASQVQFEKSYWEVAREYKVPAEYLNQGGSNEICIRIYNNNSYGGFYSGNNYAICGNELAVRAVKGLPTESTDSQELLDLVDRQRQAMAAEDAAAYGETIYDRYHNDGADKQDLLAEFQDLTAGYDGISVEDTGVQIYSGGENLYWYAAHRIITGVSAETGAAETVSEADIEVCYLSENGQIYERGNWNRCYSTTYDSELFEKELGYSVYLPPSYYEEESRMYPVVYLLHGINSSSESFVKVDGIADFMDEQIAQGNITEMIVIMPDSGKNAFYRDTEYDPANPDSTGPWQTHMTTEIRNEAESRFRILSDAKFRGLTGISMGGFGAFTIGTLYPDLYSSVASHMGAVNDEALEALKTLTPEQLEKYDFYLDCGLQDGMVDYQWTVNIHEYLQSVGKEHGYDLRDGGHNSAFYMAGMPASMKMHSDHFLKNGLYDAELQSEGGVFDLNPEGEAHQDLWIPIALNGNVIASVDGLEEGTDYLVSADGITVASGYLEKLNADTALKIRLFSGAELIWQVEIINTADETEDPGTGQKPGTDEDDGQHGGGTETSPKPTRKPTQKPVQGTQISSVNTGDTTSTALYTGALFGAAAAVLALTAARRKRIKRMK